MADLLELSSRIIDTGDADAGPALINRVSNELSEVAEDLAVVESFSHSVVIDTGEGLIAFDASHVNTGGKVVEAIQGWRRDPVRHLVYTHGHIDHVGGSPAFAAAFGEPEVVGHENVARRFDRYAYTNDWNRRINARQFGGVRADFQMDRPVDSHFLSPETRRPTRVVAQSDELVVGDHRIELVHHRGETDDHLWGWEPTRKWLFVGDFVIWNFPNAGNPQKVQRWPIEWAAALREMASRGPEVLLPAHGLPVAGRERITTMLTDIADALDGLVDDVIEMMNAGETLDAIVHTVRVPEHLIQKPYLRPFYDEPEFVVRNVWRQFGGWWDGAPSRLKPAPDAQLAGEIAELSGGAGRLAERAVEIADAGDFRLACHLADLAGWASPDDPGVHRIRADIYRRRRSDEMSLMSKGIFAGAARESAAIADAASNSDGS